MGDTFSNLIGRLAQTADFSLPAQDYTSGSDTVRMVYGGVAVEDGSGGLLKIKSDCPMPSVIRNSTGTEYNNANPFSMQLRDSGGSSISSSNALPITPYTSGGAEIIHQQHQAGSSLTSAYGNVIAWKDGSGNASFVADTTPLPVSAGIPSSATLADGTANPSVPSLAALLMSFNGTTWDRYIATPTYTVGNSLASSYKGQVMLGLDESNNARASGIAGMTSLISSSTLSSMHGWATRALLSFRDSASGDCATNTGETNGSIRSAHVTLVDSAGNKLPSSTSIPGASDRGLAVRPVLADRDSVAQNIAMSSTSNALTISSVNGACTMAVKVTGTWTGTLIFEKSYDGTNFDPCNAIAHNATTTTSTTTTGNGMWTMDVTAASIVRVRCSVTGTGTAVATIRLSVSPVNHATFKMPVKSDAAADFLVTATATGNVAHGATNSGNPLLNGHEAIAHGTNPTAVAAGQRTKSYANRAGVPFVINGHPNIRTIKANYTSAQTNVSLFTVSAGSRVVVTKISFVCSAANSANVSVDVGFGTASTPSTTGVILTHPNVLPGSGIVEGNGAGIVGIGADDEEIRITCSAPTGGSCTVMVCYYTIES